MPKKDFTSFDLYAVVQELKPQILDARVNNVYQLDAKTLLFKLHKVSQPPIQLILEAGRRLHLTNYAQEKPQAPPAF
jgi:predicted ribosome quality control (RQC) complex YloA/Tae2 family protein